MSSRGVDALIQAAGGGQRLGGRPKAFVTLWDRTLLEIAVAAVTPVADRVIVAVPPGMEAEARLVVGASAEVIAGGATRPETLRRLLAASTGPVAMLHDVVHPLTTTNLCRQVLAASDATGAAAAAIPVTSYVYAGNADFLGSWLPDARWSMRKPICFELAAMKEALRRFDADPAWGGRTEASGTNLLLLAGQRISMVPCPSWNVKVTTADDLELCRALGPLLSRSELPDHAPRPGAGPPGA